MLGTAWAGLAHTAQQGRKSFAGMGGLHVPWVMLHSTNAALPLVPVRFLPLLLSRSGCVGALQAHLNAFHYSTVYSFFFRLQAGNALPGACLPSNCVLENSKREKETPAL